MERHISWLDSEEKGLEKKVSAEYSSDLVREHLEYLTTLHRIAGTEDELRAAEYIKGKLDEFGVEAEIHEFDGYISHPGKAKLEIRSPAERPIPCLTHAFSASTAPEGMEGELISLGKGQEEDYRGIDVRGKIVLLDAGGGGEQVETARRAEEHGVAAQIHITSGKQHVIKIMQVRDVWGNPTPETLGKMPKTPVISISDEDGRNLVELIQKGPVRIRLNADASRGYRKIRHPIGTVRGLKEPEKYVLVGAHYCSWYVGATDNAAANALMLEMARVLAKHRQSLGRSIRFAWWTGHTQGTFAGSTWYLDNFWEDIRDNAIAYLNFDTLGKAGTSGFSIRNTEEIKRFHERIVKEVLGSEIESGRCSKIGDQSFWGMGLPSLTGNTTFPGETPGAGGGAYWYMHTSEDTLDKVDVELIRIPARTYLVGLLRLCNNPVLPFEFVTMAEVFRKGLHDLQKKGPSTSRLAPLVTQAEEFEKKASALNEAIGKTLSALERKRTGKVKTQINRINACLMELSRVMMPVLYSKAGKYGQDPMGTKFRPIPLLQPLEKLNLMDEESEEYKTLLTSLIRDGHIISDALHSACRVLEDTLDRI